MSEAKQGSKSTFTTSPKAEPELRLRLVGHQMAIVGGFKDGKRPCRARKLLHEKLICYHGFCSISVDAGETRYSRNNSQHITIQSGMINLLFSHNLNGKGMVILSLFGAMRPAEKGWNCACAIGSSAQVALYASPNCDAIWTKLDYACMQPSVKLDQCSGELTEYSVLVISSALVVSEAKISELKMRSTNQVYLIHS